MPFSLFFSLMNWLVVRCLGGQQDAGRFSCSKELFWMSSSNGKPGQQPSRPPSVWVTRVFAQLEGPLLDYTRRRLAGDLETARDVVQEAFVKLCQQAWPDIEPHAKAWLYKTCRNRAIDLTRREGRMNRVHTSTDVSTLHDRSQRQPEDRVTQGEHREKMRSQIEDLPDRQQEILRLRMQAGLSYKQIAEVTGLSATHVGYQLHQAITSLRVGLKS
jgi:RNA polymerase sigma-70 factor (ECF subfamily)